MKLSIVIPAYNEELNIGPCVEELRRVLRDEHAIPYELIIVNDNSTDGTADVVRALMKEDPAIRLIHRSKPGGFGRAIRSGLARVSGDIVMICMADLSDRPEDVVACYHKMLEGYDCVYGSRFMRGSRVCNYPPFKLVVNRIVNRLVQCLFMTRFNDLTNAFKAYRTEVLQACGPFRASHFNITLEMSLAPLMRGYRIAQIPIEWHGRVHGTSNLKLWQQGRRYLATLCSAFVQRWLVSDDLRAESQAADLIGEEEPPAARRVVGCMSRARMV